MTLSSKRKYWLWAGISVAVVAIVVIAVIFVIFPKENTIVGKWHLTKEKDVLPSHNITYKIDRYVVFNESGSGYSYYPDPCGGYRIPFTWKYVGNNQINITPEGNITNTYKISYKIQGNEITMEYRDRGGFVMFISYGYRVQSIPPPPKTLCGAIEINPDASNLAMRFFNITVSLRNPRTMSPEYVIITVSHTVLKYSPTINGDDQWTYVDKDGDERISTNDTIVVHDLEIKSGDSISLSYKGYNGTFTCYAYMGVIYGSLQYNAKGSNVGEGWVNSTMFLTSPSSLSPFDVHIEIENYGELRYVNKVNGDDEWTFIDEDGNGMVSNGDIIVIHCSSIKGGDTIKLTYNFYEGNLECTVP